MKKVLVSLLLKGPIAVLLAVIALVIFIGCLIPVVLIRILEWLLVFLRRMNLKEEEDDDRRCNPPFPEDVMRRPDPCIYSQRYLAAQGLPVTWNNPDIWIAKAATPNVIEPDSYHLVADTDYVVTVQVHNASTDLALGTKVRLLYRPWSFNSPDLLPVDVDVNGQEVVRFVNIAGMGSAVAQFEWHTPPIGAGESKHYCLQAHVSHPLDLNLENNMGQENTNVHSSNPGHVTAGEVVEVDVPLFNHGRGEAGFEVTADAYAIDADRTVELRLETNVGREQWPLSRRLSRFGPTLRRVPPRPPKHRRPRDDVAERPAPRPPSTRVVFERHAPRLVTRGRYIGHDDYRRELAAQDVSLPEGMAFEVVEGTADPIPPKTTRTVPVRVRVPSAAQTGDHYSINVSARREDGQLIGGVTLLLEVEN